MELPDQAEAARYRALLARRPGHALVVDDDSNLTSLIEMLLDGPGYKVTVSHNGWDALHVLGLGKGQGFGEPLRPDVVVMDYDLGDRTGGDIIAKMRESDRTKGIPVVMLTGMVEDVPESVRGQVGALLRKPFDTTAFLEAMVRVLRLDAGAKGA